MSALQLDLKQFYGSETFTRWSPLFNDVLTEGCEYVAEKAQAFWLFDYISSHLNELSDDLVVTTLTVRPENDAILALTNGDGEPLRTQRIEFTDFPEGELIIWSAKNELGAYTHMLPSEY